MKEGEGGRKWINDIGFGEPGTFSARVGYAGYMGWATGNIYVPSGVLGFRDFRALT